MGATSSLHRKSSALHAFIQSRPIQVGWNSFTTLRAALVHHAVAKGRLFQFSSNLKKVEPIDEQHTGLFVDGFRLIRAASRRYAACFVSFLFLWKKTELSCNLAP